MALGEIVIPMDMANAAPVYPVTLSSEWTEIIAAGGMDDVTFSGNANVGGLTDSDHNKVVNLSGSANHLALMFAYDDGDTPDADPVVNVWGFDGALWCKLNNVASTQTSQITLTTDENNDITDGTDLYTPVSKNVIIDLVGHKQVLVGVHTAYTVSAGNAALARLLAKTI